MKFSLYYRERILSAYNKARLPVHKFVDSELIAADFSPWDTNRMLLEFGHNFLFGGRISYIEILIRERKVIRCGYCENKLTLFFSIIAKD